MSTATNGQTPWVLFPGLAHASVDRLAALTDVTYTLKTTYEFRLYEAESTAPSAILSLRPGCKWTIPRHNHRDDATFSVPRGDLNAFVTVLQVLSSRWNETDLDRRHLSASRLTVLGAEGTWATASRDEPAASRSAHSGARPELSGTHHSGDQAPRP